MTENTMGPCRLCMYEEKCSNESNKVFNVFDSDLRGIHEKIRHCILLQLSPEDVIPPNICKNCIDKIEEFYGFLQKYQKTDEILRSIFNINPSSTQTSQNVSELTTNHLSNEGTTASTSIIANKISNDNSGEPSTSKIRESISHNSIKTDSDTSSSQNTSKHSKNVDSNRNSMNRKKVMTIFECRDKQRRQRNADKLISSYVKRSRVSNENKNLEHTVKHNPIYDACNIQIKHRDSMTHSRYSNRHYMGVIRGTRHSSKADTAEQFKACHKGRGGLICDTCGIQNACYTSRRRTVNHPFQCKYCKFTANSITTLRMHTSRNHFISKVCAKGYKSQPSLKQHVKRLHGSSKHACVMCGKGFIEQNALMTHIIKMHVSPKMYNCQICDQKFAKPKQLQEHMCTHREECVRCPSCDKDIFHKKFLKKHLLKCVKTSGRRLKGTGSLLNFPMKSN